jgi:hypothetical protein
MNRNKHFFPFVALLPLPGLYRAQSNHFPHSPGLLKCSELVETYPYVRRPAIRNIRYTLAGCWPSLHIDHVDRAAPSSSQPWDRSRQLLDFSNDVTSPANPLVLVRAPVNHSPIRTDTPFEAEPIQTGFVHSGNQPYRVWDEAIIYLPTRVSSY